MDKPISEPFIKLSSRIPFPVDMDMGDDIILTIKRKTSPIEDTFIVNCVKIEQEDNQDSTINVIYKLKYLGE